MRVSRRYQRLPRHYAFVAASLLALLGAGTILLLPHGPHAGSTAFRLVEPRLSVDLTYKRLHRPTAAIRAMSMVGLMRGDAATFDGHQASGDERGALALLLSGSATRAVDELSRIAWSGHQPAALNDLAAALLVEADEGDDVVRAVDALAAADAALGADPHYEPALFNRALALTRLGIAFEARRAWDRYLAADHSSSWADEALRNTNALGVSTQSDEWERQFAIARQQTPSAAAIAIGRLAPQFPEEARLWAEGDGLGDWATALLAGDHIAAGNTLEIVRQIAVSLRRVLGERLLADAVDAIDGAASPAELERLATGHKTFWEGRAAHRHGQPADAEVKFRDAEQIFAASGTPIVFLARYYTGSALHAQLKLRDAAEVLEALANERLDQRGYRALDATLGWERGACFMERGSLSAAMEVFTHSRDASLAAHETHQAAVFDALLASASDYAGDEREAWKARRRSFQGLSRSGYRYRLMVAIEAAAAAAMRGGQWNRAASLLGITTAEAVRQNEALVAAEAFTFRARVSAERGDTAAARRDERDAQSWAAKLPDASARARSEANVAFVDGILLRTHDAHSAIARFTDALRFFENADRRVEVPGIYLERANLLNSVNDAAGARRDLAAGIAFIESERRQIHEPGQRATLLSASDALFEKAIVLALQAGEREAAFDLVEHQRARALTEMFELGSEASTAEVAPLHVAEIRAALAPDAAIIEYAVTHDKLVIFVLRRDSFSTAVTPLDSSRLGTMTANVETAVQGTEGDFLLALTAADEVLLQPIRYALSGVRHIAISADRRLSGVPFAALHDRATGRLLIETASLTMAPSATLAIAASLRAHRTVHPSIVSVAGDAFDSDRYPRAHPLTWAAPEAKDVGAFYRQSRVITSEDATRAAVVAALATADIAHFAAHGIAKRPVANSALLLSPAHDAGGELRVGDIASLDLHGTGLVVLAACRSAGAAEQNDGAQNLALAFIAAGVPTTVASLTDLNDAESKPLMLALHRRLAAGVEATPAVREVAMDRVRDAAGNIRRPLVWSNITVIGGFSELTTMRKGKS